MFNGGFTINNAFISGADGEIYYLSPHRGGGGKIKEIVKSPSVTVTSLFHAYYAVYGGTKEWG